MEEMNFPILADEPGAPALRAEDWMAANDAAIKLIAPEVRARAVQASCPAPVRFIIADAGADAPRA